MTNEVNYNPCQYRGNSSTRTFSFNWKVIEVDELIVSLETVSTGTETILVRGSDYTATVNAVGGSVTLTTAPSEDYYINIRRSTSNYQSKGYSTSTGFSGKEIEKSFDKVSCNLQDMQYGIDTFEDETDTKVSNIQTQVNTANTNANTAISTANSATSTANSALSTANTASSNASSAVSTANTASSNASSAVSTANSANTTANTASSLATATSARVDEFEEEIEEVKEAAAKINQLEQAVAVAVASAEGAVISATQAQASAQTAVQKATEISASATQIETNKNNIGTMDNLTTTEKGSLVGAVNEVNSKEGDLTSLQTTAKNNLVSAINELSSNKANLIWYADRDFEYKVPNFIAVDKSTITIKAGTAIKLADGTYYYTATDDSYNIADILDSGTVSNGKDYYFFMNTSKELIASLSPTLPLGCVLIGGGHTLCVSVTSGNAPTLLNDSFWSSHPAIGYDAGHFIPNTAWTPAFKSGAKTGNKGMALIDFYGIPKFWVDIYLQSGTGTSTASDYSGTITNNRQCILHQWDMNQVGKKFATDQQFTIFAEGSNQQTNIAGSAIPAGRLTGGYSDTAGKRMISGFFIECCCGYLWQWGDEIAPVGGSGWSAYGDTRRGASYGMPYVLPFGGSYAHSSNCGSWSRDSSTTRTDAYGDRGGRGVSLHIERQHM